MLRTGIERELREEHEDDGYLVPDYERYCFGNVPDTVRSVLDAGGRRPLPGDVFQGVDTDVDTVILVVVDGYGLDSWKRDRHRHAFLDRLTRNGTVTPLTSVYPSETAAAITTVETGQLPCEHGRIGWNVYDPATDRSFLALNGRVKAGDSEGAQAEEAAAGVEYVYPELAAAGVDCHRLQPFDVETPGVTHHTYDELESFGTRLTDVVQTCEAPGYVYGYLPQVDHTSHAEGTDSDAFQSTVAAVCRQFAAAVDRLGPEENALLLVTADHGHVNTDPTGNVDLSAERAVMRNLRRREDGTPIRMAGSPRNVHLHLEGSVEATRSALRNREARCFTREEALDTGLFGDREATERFTRRCGDLILTHRNRGMWYADVEPDELALVGMHGGLHPSEMLVPFAVADLATL